MHCWSWAFLQNFQKSTIPKTSNFAKWAHSFPLDLSLHNWPRALASAMCPYLIFKRIQFSTIHLHTPRSINALTKSYKFGHYGSFLKVNKNTFFSKAYNLSMEHQNEVRPKWLTIWYIKVSKKSKTTSKSSKLKLCIVEVGHFSKIAKSQLSSKLQFLTKGPTSFHLIQPCHATHVSHD